MKQQSTGKLTSGIQPIRYFLVYSGFIIGLDILSSTYHCTTTIAYKSAITAVSALLGAMVQLQGNNEVKIST
jgi:hypothetical protein